MTQAFALASPAAPVRRSAEFSACRQYRYWLKRVWADELALLVCCMLNPSNADDVDDDTTVTLLTRYARRIGYGGLLIVNLFALVSSDPKALLSAADAVGPGNDAAIEDALGQASSGRVLCGWGDAGAGARADNVLRAIDERELLAVCIAATKSGNPGHPLRKRLPPFPIEWRR